MTASDLAAPKPPIDPRAVKAARNNADLYAAMFTVHDRHYERLPFAFVGRDRPPPYYSNLTVLSPDHNAPIIAELQELAGRFGGGMGLKDSFCQLELEDYGFETLFEANWIWRAPKPLTGCQTWQRIETEADLLLWETAWKASGSATPERMFPPALLERHDMAFFGQKTAGAVTAGCIANLSDDCVGLSNVFSRTPQAETFAQATATVAQFAPKVAIAGYESGAALRHARAAGFSKVGDLRILVTRAPRF